LQMLPNDLLEGAVKFHGHLGPYLILGLRAGQIGVNHLGRSYLELRAVVETDGHPPRSCFIDGIQFASGCTTGKTNLETRVGHSVSVEFMRGDRRINVTVKEDILRVLDQLTSEQQVETKSREILGKSDNELFHVEAE